MEIAHVDWHYAMERFRHGESGELARLLRTRRAIPRWQREFLADLVERVEKLPSRRGKGRAKLTHAQRESIFLELDALYHNHRRKEEEARSIHSRIEPKEVRKRNAAETKRVAAKLAQEYGVAAGTILKTHQRFK